MSKLFIIGDSVSTSVHPGWSAGQGWGALVAAAAGLTEVNLAVSGAMASDMDPQWSTAIAQYGTGDDVACMPFENNIGVAALGASRATLEGQLDRAIAAGVPPGRITLMTPFILNATWYLQAAPPFVQAIREVAFARGIPLIDVFDHFAELMITKSSISPYYAAGDNGHPSVLGQAEIASLYALPQNAGSAAYHPAPPPPPTPTGPPVITLTPLHQTAGAGPTPLSARVAYSDPAGVPAVTWNIQDNEPPSGEIALSLDGAPFPCSSSVPITPAVLARMMILPVSRTHDIWLNANNGVYWSGGANFALTPP
jgi:lysophospholipase L1-like esterase